MSKQQTDYGSSSDRKSSHMGRNGLKTFVFHTEDKTPRLLEPYIAGLAAALRSANSAEGKDKEAPHRFKDVAHRLKMVLESETLPRFREPEVRTKESEFESVGTETLRLTNTQTVKFRQKYRDIPVYGSLVTVEVDEKNELLAINSAIGEPFDVSASPNLQPDEVKDWVREQGYDLRDWDITATLYYYFDSRESEKRWRLVYIVENRLKNPEAPRESKLTPELVDYVIDAHTKELVSKLPRMRTFRERL